MYGFAIGALPADEAKAFATHLTTCAACRNDVDALRRVVSSFAAWPRDVLRPTAALWERLSERITGEGSDRSQTAEPAKRRFEWTDVAPGISCKVLATDMVNDRVSMLVRLQPGVDYPAHRHGGREELHLLDGELWIDDRKLHPGDYYSAERGSIDTRVWSETGCTCVLVTSLSDELR
jgi:anti-sigma factor ChrR (cupin superfamily)